MTIFGTRPEVIKLAPVIKRLDDSANYDSVLVSTGQHREMLTQALDRFGITPDYNLDIMQADQGVTDITVNSLVGVEELIMTEDPDLVIVQGDTTTAFAGCLAAFYQKVKVAHVEAGLRTYEKYRPFPEEINRSLITQLADLHFVPTTTAREALRNEGIPEAQIFITGNTVIDALFDVVDSDYEFKNPMLRNVSTDGRRLVVVTSHRRENFGPPLEDICQAILMLVDKFNDIEVVFSVHRNPHVNLPVRQRLEGVERVHLVEPLDYLDMANLVARCFIVLTDSGGLQEEAPALSKPVLVLRDVTERPEAVQAGMARIIGTEHEAVFDAAADLLSDPELYRSMSLGISPYGDGHAGARILAAIEFSHGLRSHKPAPFISMVAPSLPGELLTEPVSNELFYQQLDERIARARKERQRVSVATFNMEAASSEQFTEAVRVIARSLRKSDTAAALEGRHLVLVLPGANSSQAQVAAERLKNRLSQAKKGRRATDHDNFKLFEDLSEKITVDITTYDQEHDAEKLKETAGAEGEDIYSSIE
jgi:UDP-N-acetylglucosamine 2-epimerase (non-hydrolysing)